jgi:AbrB family looped-hinge helix DNA binding protein
MGIFFAMRATIDVAGRLVIPKEIRREAALRPGMLLEIRWRSGRIEIEPAPLPVKLARKGRLVVALPAKGVPVLKADAVQETRKKLRRERVSLE